MLNQRDDTGVEEPLPPRGALGLLHEAERDVAVEHLMGDAGTLQHLPSLQQTSGFHAFLCLRAR